MTQYAGARKIAGAVIDGVCRDVSKALADANGVVVVPRSRAQEVAATARTIENTESDIRALIAQGKTLTEARAALGYHGLQRRQG